MALFIWNVSPVVCTAAMAGTGGSTFGLPNTIVVTDISDIVHSADHGKSSSVSQLMANWDFFKNYSDILMEQQVLCILH